LATYVKNLQAAVTGIGVAEKSCQVSIVHKEAFIFNINRLWYLLSSWNWEKRPFLIRNLRFLGLKS